MKAAEWIDRVRAKNGYPSDYAVAKALGFKGNTISMYRSHGGTMDDGICLKVATALEIDPAIVLTDQAMERAKDVGARSAWAAVLQRLGGVAAGVLVAVGVSTAPGPTQGALNISSVTSHGMHIVSPKPRRRRARQSTMRTIVDALTRGVRLAPA